MSGPTLLGRDRELEVLHAAVASAASADPDAGEALVVVGEPGIGKSALLASVGAGARVQGCTVLAATGVQGEVHLPFAGLHQLLGPLVHRLAAPRSAARAGVATALGLADGATPDLFLVAEGTLALLVQQRGDGPVVVLVDDVHWLDPQSHRILAFVAHRVVGTGLCVLVATRPEGDGPFADAEFPRLVVTGLDDVTAERVLRDRSGVLTGPQRERIRGAARGNPLALLELPRSWDVTPPADGDPLPLSATLTRAFAGRVADLPQATRDALLVTAVESSGDRHEVLAAVAALHGPHPGTSDPGTRGPRTPDPTPEVLVPAVRAGLLTDEQAQLRFSHPLVRSGVLQREGLARRQAAHAAVADVLGTASHRGRWHRAWSVVGPDDAVADALADTVAESLRRGAVLSAVAGLERAAQLTGSATRRGARLVDAAEHALQVGRADVVSRLLRETAGLELTDLDGARVAWLTETLNDDVGPDPALLRQLCRRAGQAAALGDDELALRLLLAAALRCWWADSGPGARDQVVHVLDGLGAGRTGPGRLPARHLAVLAIVEPVLRASDVLAHLQQVDPHQVHDGETLRQYGMAAYGVGDLVAATDLLDRAERTFRAEGRLGMLPVVLALQLHIRLDLGDWSGAVLAGREVRTISRETGQGVFAENNVLVEARGMALRGRWRAALAAVADAEHEATRAHVADRICLAHQARGAALLTADRPADAFDCLRRQYDPADPGYHLRESFAGLALTVEAAVACGRADEAWELTRTLEAVAVVTPSPLLAVNLLLARVAVAPDTLHQRRHAEAVAHDLSRWPWLRARVQLAHGRWSARHGRRDDAAADLRAALEVFDRLGASWWQRTARHELDRLGGPYPGAAGGPTGRRP